MKKILILLVTVMMSGAANAADFSGLQAFTAADVRLAGAADVTVVPFPTPSPVGVSRGAAMTAAKQTGKMVCRLDPKVLGGKQYTLTFNLKKLISDPEGNRISVSPEQNYLEALNENISIVENKGSLVISGDSDGFFIVRLTLDAGSGFTKGEFSLKDSGEGCGDKRGAVTCSVAH